MSTRTPAMIRHAIRSPFGVTRFTRAAVVVAAVLACGSIVRADMPTIDVAATAGTPAARVYETPQGMLFPMEPTPKCDVLNNFGGMSKLYGSGGHQGVDIGSTLGQEVYAVEAGVLKTQFTDLGSAAGYGWALVGTSDTQYRYYHLSEFADGLAVGDTVREGQLIGFVGDTGNATPGGYHLHFEVRPGPAPYRNPVDPVPLMGIPSICKLYPKQ
jgi:murein DD-endopeptidase MepM/ murein hydrolase activator NlpD